MDVMMIMDLGAMMTTAVLAIGVGIYQIGIPVA
jgi:hypothetical protein